MDFILQGNDIIKISLESCRKRGMAFFISFRMNDQHGKEGALTKPTPGHILSVPSLYANNPQYLLGPQAQQPRWAAFVQNWAHQEVRDYKFKLIEELCQNYDLDGLELDFMRAPYYFKIAETTAEQRREIMLSFIKRVRKLLDETETPNKHRWLCVRIPSYISAYDTMGIDISAWHGAGVDMFETSSFYDTEQTTDFALIRAQAPGAAFYPELTSSIAFNGNTADRSFRRATREYLETAAHTAYTEGARGVMLFNYQYYRDNRARGSTLKANEPFTEPPFAWIKALGSPETVAKRPQYYFIGTILAGDPRREYPFPANIKPGGECVFEIDLAPPAGGWKTDTRMRMQAAAGIGGGVFEARCNGVLLAPMTDAGEPYPNVYTQMLGAPDALQAWRLPVSAMKAGRNTIVIKQTDGTPTKLIALDIAAR